MARCGTRRHDTRCRKREALARSAGRRAAVGGGRARGRRGPPPPTANAGAPRRLTPTLSRYSSRPRAMACSVGTPSGVRNSTNAPYATSRPAMAMGSTWAMSAHGGEEGEQRGRSADGDAHPHGLGGHQGHEHEHELVRNPTASTFNTAAGVRRRRSMPRCTASRESSPPVAVSNPRAEPVRPRRRARSRATSVPAPGKNDRDLCCAAEPAEAGVDQEAHERDGREHRPAVDRSRTTDANDVVDSPFSRAGAPRRRHSRSSSAAFETEETGQVCDKKSQSFASERRAAARRLTRTMPASVKGEAKSGTCPVCAAPSGSRL